MTKDFQWQNFTKYKLRIGPYLSRLLVNPQKADQYEEEGWKMIPTGRMGEIDEIANLATFVCSDFSSWLTGKLYYVQAVITPVPCIKPYDAVFMFSVFMYMVAASFHISLRSS